MWFNSEATNYSCHPCCHNNIKEVLRSVANYCLKVFCKWQSYLDICRASEGKTVEIEYRGPIEKTILDILGGVRSTCTYVGASKLKELSKRTTFIRVTQQLNEVFTSFNKSD